MVAAFDLGCPRVSEMSVLKQDEDDDQGVEGNQETQDVFSPCEDRKDWLNRKIFVGNICFHITRKELAAFFSMFGRVEKAVVVKDHTRKRSRGIGFVTFSSVEEVNNVLSLSRDELCLDGRPLRVNRAEPSQRKNFNQRKCNYLDKENEKCEDTLTAPTGSTSEGQDITSSVGTGDKEGENIHKNGKNDEPEGCVSLEEKNLTDNLTEDSLILVFNYLTVKDRVRIERVCKRWRRLALKSWSSLRHLHFRNVFKGFHGLTDQNLRSIFERGCKRIVSLDLSGSAHMLTEHALELTAHYCPDLTSVNLTGVAATTCALKTLAKGCPKLQKFIMKKSHCAGEKGLWWVFHLCPDLQRVDLESNLRVTGQCFHMFGSKLKSIDLGDCVQLQDIGVQKLSEKCGGLESLVVRNCHHLGDKTLCILGQGLTNLHTLDLSGPFPNMTESAMLELGKLTLLEDLKLSGNNHVTDSVLERIANECSMLRRLDISSCHKALTNDGVGALSQCTSLHFLNISYLPCVLDDSVERMGLSGDLVELTARACSHITNTGVIQLVDLCPNLRSLDVSGCLQITSACLHHIVTTTTSRSQLYAGEIQLNFGGTSVLSPDEALPSHIRLNLNDLSQFHLRPDRELMLPSAWEDEEGPEEFHSLRLESDNANSSTIDPEDFSDDDAAMFLDADDPMYVAELELS